MTKNKKTYFICPVGGHSPEETEDTVRELENDGWDVYWPHRDTDQNDKTGLAICESRAKAIREREYVHFCWGGENEGCLFDLGMAFILNKKIIPVYMPKIVPGKKSLQAMVNAYYNKWRNHNENS